MAVFSPIIFQNVEFHYFVLAAESLYFICFSPKTDLSGLSYC